MCYEVELPLSPGDSPGFSLKFWCILMPLPLFFLSYLVTLVPVSVARTQGEKESIYSLRYRVYVDELKKARLSGIDHGRKWVRDPEDDREDSRIFYTGPIERPTAAIRADLYRPADVPEPFARRFSLDLFPELAGEVISESSRLVVSPEGRGRLGVAALSLASYRFGAMSNKCRFGFCQVVPGLVKYYPRVGMRLYAGRMIPTPDGMRVPMMAIWSDLNYLRRHRSFLAPLCRETFGPGKQAPVAIEQFANRLGDGVVPILLDRAAVRAAISPLFHGQCQILEGMPRSLLDSMSDHGMVLNVPPGELILREGLFEQELFIVLSGEVEVFRGAHVLCVLGPGEPMGEVAMLNATGRRTASVRARSPSRLLVFNRRYVENLLRLVPQCGGRLIYNLARIMASRMSAAPTEPHDDLNNCLPLTAETHT